MRYLPWFAYSEKDNAMTYTVLKKRFLINLNLFSYDQIKIGVLCITYPGLIRMTIFDEWQLILPKSNSIN